MQCPLVEERGTLDNSREDLIRIYESGVRRVRGFDAVQRYLGLHPLAQDVFLVAIGKAASAMTLGALAADGERIVDGLVITKHGHVEPDLARHRRIEYIESDHPVPGQTTLYAGKRLLAYLSRRAESNACFLFLLSGGASSLVEVPAGEIGLEDMRELTHKLLASGLDINRINRVRRVLSGIKGGRLARHLRRCPTLSLMISDVPGDDPGAIGSGLLTRVQDAIDPSDYPPFARRLLERAELVDLPDAEEFSHIESSIVACLEDAKKACDEAATRWGYQKRHVDAGFVEGDVGAVATKLYREIAASPDTLAIWGGEPTVKLPEVPGRGGRNQQLALAVALKIKNDPRTCFLSAGTDGTDGPTDDAGAVVDGATVSRGEAAGFSAEDCLHRADAGTFLEASGDLLRTGPTGTNVMDLMIGYGKLAGSRR